MIKSTLCKQSHKYRFLLMGDDSNFIADIGIRVSNNYVTIKTYDYSREAAFNTSLYDILDTFMDIPILKELVMSKLDDAGELKIVYFKVDDRLIRKSYDKECFIYVDNLSCPEVPELKFSNILAMVKNGDYNGGSPLLYDRANVMKAWIQNSFHIPNVNTKGDYNGGSLSPYDRDNGMGIWIYDSFHIPPVNRKNTYRTEKFVSLLAAMYCEKYGVKINDDDDDIEDNDNNLKTYTNIKYSTESMRNVNDMSGHTLEEED